MFRFIKKGRIPMASDKLYVPITNTLKLGLAITGMITMSGCGTSMFAFRDTNPVIQDYAIPVPFSFKRSTNVFATTASRRLVIVTEDSQGATKTCAEPPPDVAEVFASAITAGLKAAGTATSTSGEKISAELATQYARAVATQIAPLIYRTQGLQLYRDSMYRLCLDQMNGWFTDNQTYANEIKKEFDTAKELIKEELPTMQKAVEAFYNNVKAGEARTNVGTKVLEEQDKVPSPSTESEKKP
ncbi:MAG: hypothetical protein P0107_01140 [Nitrosomonas sp.]|nr:hypothetical protein [Nitrosomonas sp.]